MSLLITEAGIAASVRASEQGISYKIAEISVGTQGYIPTPNQTSLRNEVQRKAITRSEVVGAGQLHFETVWDGKEAFEGKELGYWLDDGTLFAVDSRNGEVITYKQRDSVVTEACELNLAGSTIENITVELIGTQSATEERAGIAKIATNDQIKEGEDDTTFITPKKLKAAPKPLVLKYKRLRQEKLIISLLRVGALPRKLWILPKSASKVKFIEVETEIITSETVNIGLTIWAHSRIDKNDEAVESSADMSFIVPALSSAKNGVKHKFVVPIVLRDGGTPKKFSFATRTNGQNEQSVSKFELKIDKVWESDS